MKTAVLCLTLVCAPLHHLVSAQCATPPLPCEALGGATIVAIVDVIEAVRVPPKKVGEKVSLGDERLVVKLRVVERFKGVSPQQQEITGTIRNSYGSESSGNIERGLRYLLYAYKGKDGRLVTACSRTKLVNTPVGLAEIDQLRSCAKEMTVQ